MDEKSAKPIECEYCGEDLTSAGECEWCTANRRCELSLTAGCDGMDHEVAVRVELPMDNGETYRCQACDCCKAVWMRRYNYLAATEQI